jgi:LysM repeat protein
MYKLPNNNDDSRLKLDPQTGSDSNSGQTADTTPTELNDGTIRKDGLTYVQIPNTILNPAPKYKKPHELDGMQYNSSEMKTINFKQDYVVFIRKKVYYAATAQDKIDDKGNIIQKGEENYLRVYHVNNFTSIRTSINVNGRPGTCSVSLKGGERVTCAEKPSNTDLQPWSDWQTLLNEWLSIDNMSDATIGKSSWVTPGATGIDFKNLLKARQVQYGWKFAEKCDWEPMDEIWVFGKSRSERYGPERNYEFKFLPIFFGYIDSVTKTFQAGKNGLQININATDHLKLLDLGRLLNYPTARPGEFSNLGLDIRFPTDDYGWFAINEPYANMRQTGDESSNPNLAIYKAFTNVFSGVEPHIIVKKLAQDSGIPAKFLENRIEPIRAIPYVEQLQQDKNGDFFNADFKRRLDFCAQTAEKLFLEFFADEEGNIVLKIPNYALGANRLVANNDNKQIPQYLLDQVAPQVDTTATVSIASATPPTPISTPTTPTTTTSQDTTETISYTVVKGDCLWKIAKQFYGDGTKWKLIYDNNRSVIGSNPNLIYPGQKYNIIIYKSGSENEVNQQVTSTTVQAAVQNVTQPTTQSNDQSSPTVKEGLPLSQVTDVYIREIKPEFITSFSFIDTDKEVYNMYEIQQENNLIQMNEPMSAIRRVVPDFGLIVKFGLRPAPGVINTPLIKNREDAQFFGTMMILKSLSNRYSGSLSMIEDSAIRVGNPIRLFMYDEHPFNETGLFPGEKSQAVFYVVGIERSIPTT